LKEIRDAVLRFMDSGYSIPLEWIEEYNELCPYKAKQAFEHDH
jgi:hypothetical protein